MDPNCLLFDTIQVKGRIVHCKARHVMHFHGLFQFYTNTFFSMSTDEKKFFSTSFEAGIHRGCNLFLRVKSLPLNILVGCVVDTVQI